MTIRWRRAAGVATCAACGADVVRAARFCSRCGGPVVGGHAARRRRTSAYAAGLAGLGTLVGGLLVGGVVLGGVVVGGTVLVGGGRGGDGPTSTVPDAAVERPDASVTAPSPDASHAAASTPRCLRPDCAVWLRVTRPPAVVAVTPGAERLVLASPVVGVGGPRVTALTAGDGAVLWSTSIPASDGAAVGHLDVVVGTETVLTRTVDGVLVALEGEAGTVRWTIEDVAVAGAPTAVRDAGDVVLTVLEPVGVPAPTHDGSAPDVEVVALDGATGAVRWRASGRDAVLTPAAAVLATEAGVEARDVETGAPLWRVDASEVGTTATLTAVGDTVLLADPSAGTRLLAARSGRVDLAHPTPLVPLGAPADGLLLASDGATLLGVEEEGRWWRTDVPEGVCCGGYVVDDATVTVTLTRGRLLTLDRSDAARRAVAAAPVEVVHVGTAPGTAAGWAPGGLVQGPVRLEPAPDGVEATLVALRSGTPVAAVPVDTVVTPLSRGRVVVRAEGFLAVLDVSTDPATSVG